MSTARLLTQFGAYGDPGRDPRMSVVTVAYLAVLRDVGKVVAGTDAADAALIPVSAELFRAGRMWKLRGPLRRSQPNQRRKGDA